MCHNVIKLGAKTKRNLWPCPTGNFLKDLEEIEHRQNEFRAEGQGHAAG